MLTDRERKMLRMLILQRQVDSLSGSLSFLMRTPPEDKQSTEAHMEYLKCDLADLLNQVHRMIEDFKFDKDELLELGFKRWDECRMNFRKAGKSQYFV